MKNEIQNSAQHGKSCLNGDFDGKRKRMKSRKASRY